MPITVSSGPGATTDGESRIREDVAYMMKDLPGASVKFAAVPMEYVACGLKRSNWLDIVCVSEPPGYPSGAIVVWTQATDEQVAAIGGIFVLAEIASRALDLPYHERRYE